MANKAHWKTAEIDIIMSVFKQEKVEGRQAETGWKTNSYQAVADALVAGGHSPKTVQQITDKWGTVRSSFSCLLLI